MISKQVGVQPQAVPGLLDTPAQLLLSLFSKIAPLWNCRRTRTSLAPSQEISILFTDVVGFSHLMSVWPLENIVASLDCYFARLRRCVYRHRGQVDKYMGDGMMAVFESPNDAVRAARAIQREVTNHNLRQTEPTHCAFPTRIVIDTGRVVRTALGSGRDRDWTVMGPVVNTASHLAKTLPPGRVFVSHRTRRQLIGQGELSLAGPQVMNEHGATLIVYEVTSEPVGDTAT